MPKEEQKLDIRLPTEEDTKAVSWQMLKHVYRSRQVSEFRMTYKSVKLTKAAQKNYMHCVATFISLPDSYCIANWCSSYSLPCVNLTRWLGSNSKCFQEYDAFLRNVLFIVVKTTSIVICINFDAIYFIEKHVIFWYFLRLKIYDTVDFFQINFDHSFY